MSSDPKIGRKAVASESSAKPGLPQGYRQGIVTAITVMLGFSLYFLRFWNFEAPGTWTAAAVLAAVLMMLAVVLQVIALWRSLQIEDDQAPVYRMTLRWFLAGIVCAGLGVLVASFAI
jgi:hypothetical protein